MRFGNMRWVLSHFAGCFSLPFSYNLSYKMGETESIIANRNPFQSSNLRTYWSRWEIETDRKVQHDFHNLPIPIQQIKQKVTIVANRTSFQSPLAACDRRDGLVWRRLGDLGVLQLGWFHSLDSYNGKSQNLKVFGLGIHETGCDIRQKIWSSGWSENEREISIDKSGSGCNGYISLCWTSECLPYFGFRDSMSGSARATIRRSRDHV
jgi:hypothetical protein